MSWSKKLPGPIKLRDGRELATLSDARSLILDLTESRRARPTSLYATELILRAAETGKRAESGRGAAPDCASSKRRRDFSSKLTLTGGSVRRLTRWRKPFRTSAYLYNRGLPFTSTIAAVFLGSAGSLLRETSAWGTNCLGRRQVQGARPDSPRQVRRHHRIGEEGHAERANRERGRSRRRLGIAPCTLLSTPWLPNRESAI